MTARSGSAARVGRGGSLRTALIAACTLGLALGACAEQRAAGPPPAQSTAHTAEDHATAATPVDADAAAAAVVPTQEIVAPWVDAVRLEQWAEAAAMLDALPAAEQARAEVKYVRARAALALKDYGKAASLLHGLEAELPLLARHVARCRAEAALEAGPFEEAATYFAASTRAPDLARASTAYLKAGDVARARALANQAVVAAQRARRSRDEAEARMARARVPGAKALPDLRWIVKNAPSSPEAREAARALSALQPSTSPEARSEHAEGMVASGSAAEAVAELDRLVVAPGAGLHRRAAALFQARDYEGAAQAFLKAAASPSPRRAEQLHLAARSLARLNRDAEAISRHLEVAAKFRRTRWGERSSFLAAGLLLQVGRYEEAVAQYGRFIDAYPRSDRRADADYERALATLSSGDAAGARTQLERIARKAGGEQAAKLRELAGLAALRGGDRDGAVRIWNDVMREQPLSWGALLSRSRLAAAGLPAPPLFVPAALEAAAAIEVRLPSAAALLASMGLDGDAESYLFENEREATSPYPGHESEALCKMYGMLSPAKRRYRVGTQAITVAALQRAPSKAERWTWECVYPAPYLGAVRSLEAQHGLPQGLVHALMRQESAFDPVVVSPARAVGLLQLMPTTAENAAKELALGFELGQLTSPPVNLQLGGFYIGKLLRTFQGSLPLATAAYNAGPKAVSRWVEVGADRDTDVWVARIPYVETRNYVTRVLSNLARYQWLAGGDASVGLLPLEIPADARAPSDAY